MSIDKTKIFVLYKIFALILKGNLRGVYKDKVKLLTLPLFSVKI